MGEVVQHPLSGADRISAPAPLTIEHDLSAFDCGEEALDDWLRSRALKSEGRHARTYVLCVGQVVIGYYCICSGSVECSAAFVPGKVRRNAPNPIPISLIGRLAVDKRFAGRGLGPDLLRDALSRIVSASQVIGIGAVMVHAISDRARAFYMKHADWMEYPAESRTLFLPIETLIQAYG